MAGCGFWEMAHHDFGLGSRIRLLSSLDRVELQIPLVYEGRGGRIGRSHLCSGVLAFPRLQQQKSQAL